MYTTGLLHLKLSSLPWIRYVVHGTEMDKAVLFEGAHGVRSAFHRMAPGQVIANHTHSMWVQVMVLEGRLLVEQAGSEPLEATAGTVYFVNPDFPHTETALEETIVLVTQGEDRVGWK